MIKTGILNPHILSLIARVRHTNMLVISDKGFPFWPMIETVDISLVDGVPTVLQVLEAIRPNFNFGEVYMAEEFLTHNPIEIQQKFALSAGELASAIQHEPHIDFKKRVPSAIGLIRTGDTIPYANMILISA